MKSAISLEGRRRLPKSDSCDRHLHQGVASGISFSTMAIMAADSSPRSPQERLNCKWILVRMID